MDIAANIARVRNIISAEAPGRDITLVAVTKNRTPDEINRLLECGVSDIGENRVQEWLGKKYAIKSGYRFHHIGQLQANKVKYIAGEVCLIQSVDRLSLLEEIGRRSAAINGETDILIQVNTAREAQKAGVLRENLPGLFDAAIRQEGVRLRGFMCIAPLEGGRDAAEDAFTKARLLFEEYAGNAPQGFDTLSMGMSGDFDVALRCGATMLRLGSTLFI